MPSLLDILGYAGNFLDLPGSSVRDLLSGNNPFDQWDTPFSSDNRATGRDVLRPFLGENEETGMSGWISNPMEGVKDVAGFGLEMVADPLNFVSLSPLWRALKGRKAVKGANAAQELANRGRYGYVNAKLLADEYVPSSIGGAGETVGSMISEVDSPVTFVRGAPGTEVVRDKLEAAYAMLRRSHPELSSRVKEILEARGFDPGDVNMHLVGGRLKGKPVSADSDLDLILETQNPMRSRSVDPLDRMDDRTAALQDINNLMWSQYGGDVLHVLDVNAGRPAGGFNISASAEPAQQKLLGYTPAPESWRYPGREVGHHGGWDWSASATPEHPYGMMDLSRIHTGEGNTVKGPGGYIADDIATTPRYKQFAQDKMDEARRLDPNILERYFEPGRVIEGWSGRDQVLQFNRGSNGGWAVEVQKLDEMGNPMAGERPRWHSTMPDDDQLDEVLGPGPKAKTYTLDMPAGTKERMMNWEGRFVDQPQAVKQVWDSSSIPDLLDQKAALDASGAKVRSELRRIKKEHGITQWGQLPDDPPEINRLFAALDSLQRQEDDISAHLQELTGRGVDPVEHLLGRTGLTGETMADLLMGQHPAYAGFEDVTGLKEAGVPGMKNLAGSTGKASYNYAIWDQDLINQMRVRAIDGQEMPINPMFGPVQQQQRVIPQIADSPLTEVVNPMSTQPLPGLAKPAMQGAAYQALARFNSYGGSL